MKPACLPIRATNPIPFGLLQVAFMKILILEIK